MRQLLILTIFFNFNCFAKGFLPKTFSAEIEQVFVSGLYKKKNISQGTIDYSYPGNIRFEILKPKKVILVANPKKYWYYRGSINNEPGELIIQNAKKLSLADLFDPLTSELKSSKKFKVFKKKTRYRISFNDDLKNKLDVKELVLNFKKSIYDQIEEDIAALVTLGDIEECKNESYSM